MPAPGDNFRPSQLGGPAGRFVGGVFGLIFGGIGLTVLIFLWSAPMGGFGSPPLFFRVFGSFIAFGFIVMGGVSAVTAIAVGRAAGRVQQRAEDVMRNASADVSAPDSTNPTNSANPSAGYVCPSCGAPLTAGADVSPSGDAKCGYCHRWFNIHRPGGAA